MTPSGNAAGFAPASLLTRAELLDHARHPRNRGELHDADVVQTEDNPLCGDVVTVYVKLKTESRKQQATDSTSYKLQATSFTGSGCIISQAAASVLSEEVVGKSVTDIQRMQRADMEALLGGSLSPSRVKCAMLPLLALKRGLTRS